MYIIKNNKGFLLLLLLTWIFIYNGRSKDCLLFGLFVCLHSIWQYNNRNGTHYSFFFWSNWSNINLILIYFLRKSLRLSFWWFINKIFNSLFCYSYHFYFSWMCWRNSFNNFINVIDNFQPFNNHVYKRCMLLYDKCC